MPQTPPFHFLVPGRKLSNRELASAMRLDLEAELDAINLYAAHLEATDDPQARAILQHVIAEEQEHAALFTELVHRLDPDQAKQVSSGSRKFALIVAGAPHQAVEAAGEGASEAKPEPTARPGFTVGNARPG